MEIGDKLREARLRKGLTIKDVEAATKIRARYLQALEDEDFDVIPGPTFVKAFLRTYATFLKIDADALIEEYKANFEPRSTEHRSTLINSRTQRQGSTGAHAGSLSTRAIPGSSGRGPKSSSRFGASAGKTSKSGTRPAKGYLLVAVVALVVVALLAWFTAGRGEQVATLKAENIAAASTPTRSAALGYVSQTSTSQTSPSTSSPSSTTSEVVQQPGSRDVVLKLSVTMGECWLVVKEDGPDGAELYAGTLSAGGQQTFDSAKRYWLMVGAPDVLNVSVNGKTFALSGQAGAFIVTPTGVERAQ